MGLPVAALTSAGTVKMPTPIMLVITKAPAPQTLSARRNCAPASAGCRGLSGRRLDRSSDCCFDIDFPLAGGPSGDDFRFRLIILRLDRFATVDIGRVT